MTKEKRKILLVSLTSLAVLVVVFFLALLMGRYSVSPEAFLTVITGGDPANSIDKSVILTLRLVFAWAMVILNSKNMLCLKQNHVKTTVFRML